MYPAAICERPALWTQTNRTVGLSVMRKHRPSIYETLVHVMVTRSSLRSPAGRARGLDAVAHLAHAAAGCSPAGSARSQSR